MARVLVVEDELVTAALLRGLLAHLGYHTAIAANASDAVEIFRGESFDIVVTDIEMPRMNGDGEARRIRMMARGCDVAIIALSSLSGAEHVARCFDCGMDAVIAKPVTEPQLREVLARTRHLPAD